MLQIFTSTKELKFRELCSVYADDLTNQEDNLLSLEAEQNFYLFLINFLKLPDTFYAVWVINSQYVSALRVESYRDGVLLTGLYTRQEFRGKGYAEALINNTLSHLFRRGIQKIYSHIRNDNISSIRVHLKCGFEKINDYAAYIDGSVDWRSATYLKNAVSHSL